MSKHSVRFEKLNISVEDKVVIDNLHASIEAKCCTVILGPGNSGKSTLFAAIADCLPAGPFAIKGKLHLNTRNVRLMDQNPIRDYRVSPAEFFGLHGRAYGTEVVGCWHKYPDLVQELLALENVPFLEMEKKYHRLIAFTLTQAGSDVDLLLLDEPEVKVEENMPYLINRINDLKKEKTVMVNTHHMFFARSIADKMMVLFYGKLKEYSDVSDFLKSENPDVQYIIKMGC